MMTITSSLSSSLVSLPRLVATSWMQHGPARPLGCLWFWGHGRACSSHLWQLVVVQGVVVVVVLAGCSQPSVWRWPSVAGCCPLCVRLSRCWGVWVAGVVRGGGSHVTWHAGDMDGARSPGYMGVWLSHLVGRLLWFDISGSTHQKYILTAFHSQNIFCRCDTDIIIFV